MRKLRALITRPRSEADALAAALARRGIVATVEPLIEIRFAAAAAPDLSGVQAVLCTSANGVRALAQASTERGVPLFAVGDVTASRARAEGFLSVESAGGDAGDLARLVCARLHPGAGRLVHVAGNAVAGDLAGALRGAGFAVDRAVLYEARPVARLSEAAIAAFAAGEIGVALFFSPRTAVIFARLAAACGVVEMLDAVDAVSISPGADAALAGLPFRERLIAAAPTQAAMLDRVDALLAVLPA
jgi:uroporphyrinogen-III synthase